MKKDEQEIQKILRELGLSGRYLGFRYLTHAIQLAMEDETQLLYISKSLYSNIADRCRTSVYCVERDIRTAVHIIWKNQNKGLLNKICLNQLDKCPSNSVFIDLLVAYLKKQ